MKISRNATDINYKSYKSTETRSNTDDPMALGEPGWKRFDSDDGMIYWVRFKFFKSAVDTANYVDIPNNQNISSIWVDINGAEGPNMIARDVFKFALYNDGTLRPWGAHGFMRLKENIPDDAILWDDNHACTSEKVTYANSCAGSIFDNGMKIIYQ